MTSFVILLVGTVASWGLKGSSPRASWRVGLAASSLALVSALIQIPSLPWESTMVTWQPARAASVEFGAAAVPWTWSAWIFLLTTVAAAIASAGARRKSVGVEEGIALAVLALAAWVPLVATGHPSLWLGLVAFDLLSMSVGLLACEGSAESRRVVYQAAGGILAVSLLSLAVPVGTRSVVGLGAQSLLLIAYLLRVGGVPWRVELPKRWPLLAAARDGLTVLLAIRLLQEFIPADPETLVGWAAILLGLIGVGLALIRSLVEEDLSGVRSASLLAVASLPLLAWGSMGHAEAGLGVPAYLLVVFPLLARIQVSGVEERVWIGLICLASLPWITAPAGSERLALLIAGNVLLQTCLWYGAIRYARSAGSERPALVGLEPTLDRLSLAAPLATLIAFRGTATTFLGELPHAASLVGVAAAAILAWVSPRTAGRGRRRWQRVVAVASPPAGPNLDAAIGAAARSIFGGIVSLLEGDGALLWLAVGLLYAGLAASSLLAG